MISKSHPLANFLKVTGNIYATTLQRVKEDSQARAKEDPTFSGISPDGKLPEIIELKNQNSFKLITNYLVEKIVKCVRFIR